MIRVAFITRSTFYQVHGGNGIQVTETVKSLRDLGVDVEIILTHGKINYSDFDLLHFFDLVRPANILRHIRLSNKPFVITPTLVDFSGYDKHYRKGLSGIVFKIFSGETNEYFKTVGRWILGKDSLVSKEYLWKGQGRSIREILAATSYILASSPSELKALRSLYKSDRPSEIIYNGVNTSIFNNSETVTKEKDLVICAARIEGIKNQLNLIKALIDKPYRLLLIGEPSQNQKAYYKKCTGAASTNIEFVGKVSQEELVKYYRRAKVHVLPSWFETCGLSSLEAAAMGCSVVITDKGFTRDYFEDDAFYCEPGNPQSIYNAIVQAANSEYSKNLQNRISTEFTWQNAARKTLEVYKKVLKKN